MVQLIIIIVGMVVIRLEKDKAIFIMIIAGILLILVGYYFCKRNAKKIRGLSSYLDQIYNGNYMLDIRDNEEGELSLLKNEIYKVTLRLAEQADLLKKDKLYLADSIADISHQLKTPLTSMMVMSDLLNQDNLPVDKRMEFTGHITRQLTRMDWLVTSLLKLSKMDAGTILMKKERILVKKLIKQALNPLLISLEIKQIGLVIEGEDQVSYLGDFDWSKEALTNILKNCVEHSGQGSQITIKFDENTIYTSIIITDQGEGIDAKDLPHIFERFYRGNKSLPDSVGIGLAMARNIFINQNGKIEAISKIGEGTTFTIKIYKRIV